MAKWSSSLSRANGNQAEKNNGTKLKIVMEMLQRSFLLAGKRRSRSPSAAAARRRLEELQKVPEDVKEGHFAVMAVDDEDQELRRFVVPLSCLTRPAFVRLLEEAAEEYGFEREGAIMVPCTASELERILAEQWVEETQSKSGWIYCTAQDLLGLNINK